MAPHYSNAFYALSCLNQFDGLDKRTLTQTAEDRQPTSCLNQSDGLDTRIGTQTTENIEPTRRLQVLIYGLFRPLSAHHADPDVRHSRQLLSDLAYQLRMLRRKNVIPTLASLGTFLIAFIFSIVLAFAELGEHNTPFSLSFGLLVSWLPLLVVFTIVDRNPSSADRSA